MRLQPYLCLQAARCSRMPSYLTEWALWRDLLPLPLFATLVTSGLVFGKIVRRDEAKLAVIVVGAMALLGIVTGQLTGQSREPAVGAVLPAVLGLIGGVTVYLFAMKEPKTQVLVGLAVVAFSINMLVGTFWGAKLRADFNAYQANLGVRLAREAVEHEIRLQQAVNEKQLLDIREALKLPPLSQSFSIRSTSKN